MNVSSVQGPTPRDLQEIRSRLVGQPSSRAEARLPGSDLVVDVHWGEVKAHNGDDARLLYKAGMNEIPQAIGLSPDGRRAVFSLERNQRHEIVSTSVAGGWLTRKLAGLDVLGSVPATATDIAVAPDGAVAVAMNRDLQELQGAGEQGPPQHFPGQIEDVEYLGDGSIVVRTSPRDWHESTAYQYFWAPDAQGPFVQVPLKDVDPKSHEHDLRTRLESVPFLNDRPLDELEAFDRNDGWAQSETGLKGLHSIHIADDPDREVVFAREPGHVGLWIWQHSTAQAVHLGELHLDGTFKALVAPDGSAVAVWVGDRGRESEQAPTTVEVFQRSGQHTTLPDLEGLLFQGKTGSLSFQAPQGRVEVQLKDVAGLAAQPWFMQKAKADLLGGSAPVGDEPPGTISVNEEYVDIGSVRVAKAGAPPPTAPDRPALAPAQPAGSPAPAVAPAAPEVESAEFERLRAEVAKAQAVVDTAREAYCRADRDLKAACASTAEANQAVESWMDAHGWSRA